MKSDIRESCNKAKSALPKENQIKTEKAAKQKGRRARKGTRENMV